MKKILLFGAVSCFLAACTPSVSVTPPPVAGNADFTNYLAIGNSLTAGFADGSLYVTGQLNSYPQRLFEQFSQIPIRGAQGPFVQPLLYSDLGYPNAKLILAETYPPCLPKDSSLGPISYPGWALNANDATPYVSSAPNGQINNIGVPGIRIVDYPVAGYGTNNPYAARFYHNPATTPLDELFYRVHNLHPTFFTMWLGANDVLGYATAGGQGDGSGNASPAFGNYYNTNDISNFTAWEKAYDTAVKVAISSGAGGALINIPDITTIPYFTTIPANGITLNTVAQVNSMKALWPGSNFTFDTGSNYFIIRDHANHIRQAVPGELILLTATQDSILCNGWGTSVPIPNQYVITTDELQNIRTAVTTFNNFIQNEAIVYNLAYVDMNTYLSSISKGTVFNGITYNAQFVEGGAFSLDGIHLTPRGYALIANQIITTINAHYKSTIRTMDVNQYNGILYP